MMCCESGIEGAIVQVVVVSIYSYPCHAVFSYQM